MTTESETRPRQAPDLRGMARLASRHLYPHWGLWAALLVLFAVNMAWIAASPRLGLAPGGAALMAAVFLGTGLAVAYAELRGPVFDRPLRALHRSLMVALLAGFLTQQVNLFSHLGMSLALPLADARLTAWDRALGFDWNGYAQAVAADPWGRAALLFAYGSLLGPAFGLILGIAIWRSRHVRAAEVDFLVLVSGVACVGLGAFFPANDAWNSLATPETRALLGGQASPLWLDQFNALRGKGPVLLDPRSMEGIVSFPSFHAALAAIVIWGSRGSLWGQFAGLVCGLAILLATPVCGGHYGVDLLGGVLVVAVAVLAWRRLGRIRSPGGG